MFLLIDKPAGISSFDVIRKLRKSLGIKKMGFAGTLDPLATGCLLIATDKSTKLLSLFDRARKEYIFSIDYTHISDSLDLGTPLREISYSGANGGMNPDELIGFIKGQKTQIPPKYSALHIDGSRAYELALNGKDFIIAPREITVDEVEILEQSAHSISLRMIISSGGYIRSFAPILAELYGYSGGGVVTSLRRTKIISEYGMLDIQNASSIDSAISIHLSNIFLKIPTKEISDKEYMDLKVGKVIPFSWNGEYPVGFLCFLIHKNTNFTSLCDIKDGYAKIIKNDVA